jgi:hypothetical protein
MDRYRHPRTKGLTPMMVIELFAPHGTLNAERRHRLGQWLITEVMRTDSAPAAVTDADPARGTSAPRCPAEVHRCRRPPHHRRAHRHPTGRHHSMKHRGQAA